MKRILFALFLYGVYQNAFSQDANSVEREIQAIQATATYKLSQADSLIAPRMDISTEGGQATAYTHNNELFLIEEELYGETGQIDRSFYFQEGELKAVVDVTTNYNRPLYGDAGVADENNDDEVFDNNKSSYSTVKFLYKYHQLKYRLTSSGEFQDNSDKSLSQNGEQLLKYAFNLRSTLFPSTLPNIQLKNKKGEIINSADLLNNGKAKVFVFWSRYCGPCKAEMKAMTNIGKEWFEDFDAEIILVSLAGFESLPYESDIVNFLSSWENEEGIYFLHDNKRKLYENLGSLSFPATYLFDKEGNLYRDWDYYNNGLETSVGLYFQKLAQTGS